MEENSEMDMEIEEICEACLDKGECHLRDVENGRSAIFQDQFEHCQELGRADYRDDEEWECRSLAEDE